MKLKGRTFLTSFLERQYLIAKDKLIKALAEASDIGSTMDCWTSRHKSYLGMCQTPRILNIELIFGMLICLKFLQGNRSLVLSKSLPKKCMSRNTSDKRQSYV